MKEDVEMTSFCPFCENETQIEKITETENMDIRGEIIPVEREYYRCKECGEEFELATDDYDPYDTAYREYRRRKDWVQPEEIKKFREEIGLTQQELSDILGIGIATLNRYENGALQTEANNNLLKLIMCNPENLISLIKSTKNAKSNSDSETLIAKLQDIKFKEVGESSEMSDDLALVCPDNATQQQNPTANYLAWPGLSDAIAQILKDVNFTVEAGKYDERLFSTYMEDNLRKIRNCIKEGDYPQASSCIQSLVELLGYYQDRSPAINMILNLVKDYYQLIIETENIRNKYISEKEERINQMNAVISFINDQIHPIPPGPEAIDIERERVMSSQIIFAKSFDINPNISYKNNAIQKEYSINEIHKGLEDYKVEDK